MWSAKQKYQSSRKRCVPKIPGHVLENNTRNLYGFFSSSFKIKYVHTFVHTVACTVVFVGPAGFGFNATCPLSFQLFQRNRWSRGRFNCISTLACKLPVCVAFLTNFYGRFFVEVGQFISSKVFPLRPPFFSLADSASLWRVQSWKRVFRKSTSLPETVCAWSA